MKLTLLAGGVGGGRMADGFAQILGENLTVVVNTGDDFDIHGLRICPDLDSVLYTMAGISNEQQGWGLAGETFQAHKLMGQLGLPDWFLLGDKDLAIHIARRHWLNQGQSLTEATAKLAQSLGVKARLVPMTDAPVSTWVEVAEGFIPFQEYFVKRRHQDTVLGFQFRGIEQAAPTPQALSAFKESQSIVLAPSNPFVSIDPILALGLRSTLLELKVPRVAVSPILGGQSVKGPAAQMLRDLGWESSCQGIADYYRGLIDGIVIDTVDEGHRAKLEEGGLKVLCCPTLMRDRPGRLALAQRIIDWLAEEFSCER